MSLIVFEGIDGCGKSTQIDLLAERLRRSGREVLCLREPGGTDFGERIRSLVLDPSVQAVPRADLFLFLAARAQLMAERVLPALMRGSVVLLDRFYHSTLAYQGPDLPNEDQQRLREAIALAIQNRHPDKVIYLALDPTIAAERRRLRDGATGDRIEQRGIAFQQRVAESFEALTISDHLVRIPADHDPATIAAAVWGAVAESIQPAGRDIQTPSQSTHEA
jgi:dTMP kinase